MPRCRLAVLTLLLAGLGAVPAHAGVTTYSLYPAQTSSCPATDTTSQRVLALAVTASTPCPRPAASTSGRADETYRLAAPPTGTVAGDLTATVTFVQNVAGTAIPGYVDATVQVVVNGSSLGDLHVSGPLATAPVRATVTWAAGKVRGAAVHTFELRVHWNTGTTPWVEPAFDGGTVVHLPLATPDTNRLRATFHGKVDRAVKCPPGAPAVYCFEVTASGNATGLGAVTLRRLFTLVASKERCQASSTWATLTAKNGSLSFTGTGTICSDVSQHYTVKMTSGTGAYAHATGKATITVPAHTLTETWDGSIVR